MKSPFVETIKGNKDIHLKIFLHMCLYNLKRPEISEFDKKGHNIPLEVEGVESVFDDGWKIDLFFFHVEKRKPVINIRYLKSFYGKCDVADVIC